MAKDRRAKVHLYQADHGLARCGREVDGLGPMVAENVLELPAKLARRNCAALSASRTGSGRTGARRPWPNPKSLMLL